MQFNEMQRDGHRRRDRLAIRRRNTNFAGRADFDPGRIGQKHSGCLEIRMGAVLNKLFGHACRLTGTLPKRVDRY